MIPDEPLIVLARTVLVHESLRANDIQSCIGGALALAYHVSEPRATRDVDLNISLDKSEATRALEALPDGPIWGATDVATIRRDGQVRLWWPVEWQTRMPLDLFFAEHTFHRVASSRALMVPMLDAQVPILSATDLTVFKALFDRPKDWVDIDEMVAYGPPTLDLGEAADWVAEIVGEDDARAARLRALAN